jgi:uncharacterized protein
MGSPHVRGPRTIPPVPRAPHFLQSLLAEDAAHLALYRDDDARPVAATIEPAFDSASRRRGLLGRDALDPDTAVIIAPSNAVHTFFMRFPIDLIFAARDGRVLKLRYNVRPWRLSASMRAFAVVELAAGTLAKTGVHVGDKLAVRAIHRV